MKEIAGALVKAQKAFGPALKLATNPHLRTKYADLAAVVEAVSDAFNNNGIFMSQQLTENENGVVVETVFVHESGETLSGGKLFLPAAKKDAQGFGSALTYARRYSLMTACGIAPEDDDGHNASKRSPRHSATQGALIEQNRESILLDTVAAIQERKEADDVVGMFELCQSITDSEEKTYLWGKLDAPTRRAIKAHGESIKEKA